MNMLETNFYKARSQLSWSLIGGLDQVKTSLIEALIWPIKYKSFYQKLDMKESGGVLLYGPSGCGKTLIGNIIRIVFIFFILILRIIMLYTVNPC